VPLNVPSGTIRCKLIFVIPRKSHATLTTMSSFSVQQIDHVEMFVPDRHEAAEWYRQVLGLEIIEAYRSWAAPGGPLMIATREGSTKLALFEGASPTGGATNGFHRVAFRTDGEGFVSFLARLEELALRNRDGRPVTAEAVFDHEMAFSIYFSDPYGHNLELTTYDHESVRSALAAARA
jgi:catechol 2,3-dioxygenase-like lactoylglutathione lyase family enzyme